MKFSKIPALSEYINGLSQEQREQFERDTGTTIDYMRQLAGGHSRASIKLAKILSSRTPVTREQLRSDVWGKNSSSDE